MGYIVDENGRVISDDSKRSNQSYSKVESTFVASKSDSLVYSRIFGYMFAGLLITALTAFLLGFIFAYFLSLGGAAAETASEIYMFAMIASIIGVVIINFTLTKRLTSESKSLVGPLVTYCVIMGLMLSTFTIFVDWRFLGGAFLLTSLMFGVLSLISVLLKNHMRPLLVLASGLSMGILFAFPLYLILSLFINNEFTVLMYMGISGVLFLFMLIMTVIDIARIREIAERGGASKNVELYCAFSIYLDFVYIFIRMVYYILLFSNRRK